MKRLLLIGLVTIAMGWILYSSYDLWINKDNSLDPQFVFCELDESILVINNLEETKATDFIDILDGNILASMINNVVPFPYQALKIYASQKRPILIFEKTNKWEEEEINYIKSLFKLNNTQFKNFGNRMMVFQDYQSCTNELSERFFYEADKKASANIWIFTDNQWKRTDMYNLQKGYFEYRSSAPESLYGKAVKDIDLFSSVIPVGATSYQFVERFYAQKNDSIYRNGPMDTWVDLGFVIIQYEDYPVLISDYRSQQLPSLVLIEQTQHEDSVKILDEIYAFQGFQLTKDFPTKTNGKFYCFDIEDKSFFVENEKIARKILIDYQLGKTLALSPERKEQFFSGLPSYVNLRTISSTRKSSLTWKDKLLFEVNTLPPQEQLTVNSDKNTWSISPNHETVEIIPIIDHLREGVSIFSYSKSGKYQLFDPNGRVAWGGELGESIVGKVQVIDLLNNGRRQFLFKTSTKVHLIDLNGNEYSNFPYQSDHELTSELSLFEWNNLRRILVGNQKGEIVMLKSEGQELNVVQTSKAPIISTPFALNSKGNLVAWAVDSDYLPYLAYLETPAKPKRLSKIEGNEAVKSDGKIYSYFERDNKVYRIEYNVQNDQTSNSQFIDEGKLYKVTDDYFLILQQNTIKVFNYKLEIQYTHRVAFNEVGDISYIPEIKTCVVLDYLQNKIYAYNKLGEEIQGFPKEGRNKVTAYYHEGTLYVYTLIEHSILCYKVKV